MYIPQEIELEILDYVDLLTFSACLRVCRRWRSSLSDSIRGNEILCHKFGMKYGELMKKNKSFGDFSRKKVIHSKDRKYWMGLCRDYGVYGSGQVNNRSFQRSENCAYFNVCWGNADIINADIIVTTGNDDLSIWQVLKGSEVVRSSYFPGYLRMSEPSVSHDGEFLLVTNIPRDGTGVSSVKNVAQLFKFKNENQEMDEKNDNRSMEPIVGYGEVQALRTSNAYFFFQSSELILVPTDVEDNQLYEGSQKIQVMQVFRRNGEHFCNLRIRGTSNFFLDMKFSPCGKYIICVDQIDYGEDGSTIPEYLFQINVEEQVKEIMELEKRTKSVEEDKSPELDVIREPQKLKRFGIEGNISNTKISSDGKYCLVNMTREIQADFGEEVPMEIHILKMKDFSRHRILTGHYGFRYSVTRMDSGRKLRGTEICCCGCRRTGEVLIWSMQFGFIIRRVRMWDKGIAPHVAISPEDPFKIAVVMNNADVNLLDFNSSEKEEVVQKEK